MTSGICGRQRTGSSRGGGLADFAVTVHKLDPRPGGELLYAMTAIDPPQVAFTKRAGMPLTHECRIRFTEVVPRRCLAFVHLVDFIPSVAPYDVAAIVELEESSDGVRMMLTIDRMHDDEWTKRAVMGWDAELGKLEALIERRIAGGKR